MLHIPYTSYTMKISISGTRVPRVPLGVRQPEFSLPGSKFFVASKNDIAALINQQAGRHMIRIFGRTHTLSGREKRNFAQIVGILSGLRPDGRFECGHFTRHTVYSRTFVPGLYTGFPHVETVNCIYIWLLQTSESILAVSI